MRKGQCQWCSEELSLPGGILATLSSCCLICCWKALPWWQSGPQPPAWSASQDPRFLRSPSSDSGYIWQVDCYGAGTWKPGKSRSCFLRWQGHKELGKQYFAFSVIQLHEKLSRCSATHCKILIMEKAPSLQGFPFRFNFDNISIFLIFCMFRIFKNFCGTSNKFIAKNSHTTSDIFWEIRYLCHFFILSNYLRTFFSCHLIMNSQLLALKIC